MKKVLTLKAPAKINLWLEVLGRRPDGYHDLSTLMIPLDWGDDIILEIGCAGISLMCTDKTLGEDDRNLAFRAARVFFHHLKERRGNQECGVRVQLVKRIPIGAGLGGGSSDAAAVLRGLNILLEKPFEKRELMHMALSLGADVPFFIEARPALATGVGEKLRFLKTEGKDAEIPPLWFVIVKPDFEISTREAYSKIKLTRKKDRISIACLQGSRMRLREVIRNDLEQFALLAHPEIGLIKRTLIEKGAVAALMTGSGSAVFGVCENEVEAIRIRNSLAELWPEYFVFTARGAY